MSYYIILLEQVPIFVLHSVKISANIRVLDLNQ